ncbi:MAG: hypothetical protein ACRECO_07410 [Xanthobacteraceae bacterium]
MPAGTFASARLIVVAPDDRDGGLIGMIARMGFASVRAVRCLDAARDLCAAGDIDACLVLLPRTVPDESLPWTVEDDAPGRDGIPSLLLAEAVTPYVAACARRAGYSAVASLSVPPRILYRCIRALLQLARQGDRGDGCPPAGSQTSRVRRSGRLGTIATATAGPGKQRLQ